MPASLRIGRTQFGGATLAVAVLFAGLTLGAATSWGDDNAESLTPPIQYTPVVGEVLQAPQAVCGSDGYIHLVYEVLLTNAGSKPVTIEQVDIVDGEGTTLKSYSDAQIPERMALSGSRAATNKLDLNQSAIFWVNLVLPNDIEPPASLVHHFTILWGDKEMSEDIAKVAVDRSKPIVIGPPLKGDRWCSADGCCEAPRHVRAALSVNGKIYSAQRFAIDWERLDKDNRLFTGDPKNVENYACYGLDVIAVADAKVVTAIDKFKNQVPGGLPANIKIEEADGNHVVLDLGKGHYCLYAHLKPGSVLVKPGDVVKRGQVLAQVGNTGNTTAPHLHFHVMNGPSSLASGGLPYLLDRFAVMGHWHDTKQFDDAEAKGIALPVMFDATPVVHKNELPLDYTVYDFLNGDSE